MCFAGWQVRWQTPFVLTIFWCCCHVLHLRNGVWQKTSFIITTLHHLAWYSCRFWSKTKKRHPNAFIVQLSRPYRLQNSYFDNVKDRPSGRWEMTHTAPQDIPRLGTTTSSEPSALEYPDAQHESSYRHDMSEQAHPAIKERMTTTRQFISLQNPKLLPASLKRECISPKGTLIPGKR